MSHKGSRIFVSGTLIIVLLFSGILLLGQEVAGTAPEVNSITYEPLEPTVEDEFNITVIYDVYDEPITSGLIQICIDGICYLMEDMETDGSGTKFWKVYEPNSFPANKIIEFHLYLDYGQGPVQMHGENVTFAPVPKDVFLNGTLSRTTLKPEQTVTVDGNLTYDIGGPVEGADINLSIASLGIFNTTQTDEDGNFTLDLLIPEEGEFTLDLDAVHDTMSDHMDWMVTVSPWDLPNMDMGFESIDFDELDAPPGSSGDIFYTDANVTLFFNIYNTGTDSARNITASVTIENASQMEEIDAGDLLPGERYPASFLLNTTMTGHYELNVTAQWDQEAPYPDGFVPPTYTYAYDVMERPMWTGHTVFVEMFTQTTCGPCVYVEESLERLYHEGLDFQFVVYVTEDTESGLIAQGKNITATPVLFVDNELYRKDGASDELESEMEEIRGLIEDAASLERPPISMGFTNGESLTISSYLDPEYRNTVSGIIEIYRIEVHSNLRNYQEIPMSHRYLGSVAGQEINDLQPGNYYNFSVDRPVEGEALVAVLVDDEGTVIQTASFTPMEEPTGYLGTNQVVLNIESPGEGSFNLTIEKFMEEDASFDDLEFMVTESGFPGGWNIAYGSGVLSPPGVQMTMTYSGAAKEIKPVGRVRYSQDYMVTLTVPENTTGTFDFNIDVEIGNYTYTMLVVVIVPEPGAPPIEITSSYLAGEGKTIYFYVEATDIPEGANVKGRILPCNYGPGAACGLPVDFLLTKISEGKYRASVVGVDLETYTHLTYSAWVEYEDMTYSQTEEVQVEISSLVTIETDDDDDGISPWIIIASIAALVIILVLAIVFIIMARRSSEEEEPIEEVEGEVFKEEGSEEDTKAPPVEEGPVSEESVTDETATSETGEEMESTASEEPEESSEE